MVLKEKCLLRKGQGEGQGHRGLSQGAPRSLQQPEEVWHHWRQQSSSPQGGQSFPLGTSPKAGWHLKAH